MASPELLEKLELFFDDEINSYLEDHGGGAQPVEVNGSELVIRMTGECRSCMSQSGTINDLILKKVVDSYNDDDKTAEYLFTVELNGDYEQRYRKAVELVNHLLERNGND